MFGVTADIPSAVDISGVPRGGFAGECSSLGGSLRKSSYLSVSAIMLALRRTGGRGGVCWQR